MNGLSAVLSLASGGAAGWGLFRLLFAGWDDFGECIRFWLTPDWLSAVRGEWTEDQWSEMRLFIWAAGTGGCGFGGWAAGSWLMA